MESLEALRTRNACRGAVQGKLLGARSVFGAASRILQRNPTRFSRMRATAPSPTLPFESLSVRIFKSHAAMGAHVPGTGVKRWRSSV